MASAVLTAPAAIYATTRTVGGATPPLHDGAAYGPALLGVTLAFMLVLSRLFHGPNALASLASRLGVSDAESMRREAERAWRASLGPSALFFVVVVVAGLASRLGSLAVVTLVAVGIDLVRATRLAFVSPELEPVWEERRVAAVPLVRALLRSSGIASHAQGTAFAGLWQVFAPYAPVTILVARSDEARARGLLAERLLGVPSGEGQARPNDTPSPTSEQGKTPTRGLAVASLVAGIALLLTHLPTTPSGAPPARRTSLEIVRIDDTISPFDTLADDAIPEGSGISIARESIPGGRNGPPRELAYARVAIAPGESKAAARARLDAFLAKVPLPEGARFGLEAKIDDGRYPEDRREGSLRTYVLVGESAVSERDVVDAVPVAQGPSGAETSVSVELSDAAAKRFEELTASWTRRRVAIVVDGEIASAPLVLSAIGGGRISLSVGRGDPELQAALATKLARGLRGR
jgi:hypothetical protein